MVLRLAGYRSALRSLPEFCALVGLPAFVLSGYLLFMFSNSAISILPGVVAAGLAAEFLLRRRAPSTRVLDGPLAAYRDFRSTRVGIVCWAIFLIAAMIVLASRWGWLTERSNGAMVEMGTLIADDMRTVGFPISLAAFGFPLRNPLAAETLLMYPLGAFVYPTGIVALFPSQALQAIVADTVVGVLFWGLVLMLFTATLTRGSAALSILFSLTCVFTLAFDWGAVPLLRDAAILRPLFDYVKPGVPSVGSTTLVGLVWVENHALAFSALAAAALLLSMATPVIPALLVAFGAATSMDMTIFALVAAGIWILWRRRLPPRFTAMCVLAACIVGLIMLPSLSGKMDGLRPRGPSLPTDSLARIGAIISTEGPYFLLLAVAHALVRAVSPLMATPNLVPLAAANIAPMLFLLAFHYGSFWFWRGHFVMHSLLAMLCAATLAAIPASKIRNALIALWALSLIPGIWNASSDIRWFRTASLPVPTATADAIRWIYRNTRLDDRVAAWKAVEASLVPSVDYLRAGSRAGKKVYDRAHVVIGYQRNLELMTDLPRGIAANDYILYEKDDPSFQQILSACRAPAVFENSAAVIYRIEATCRANLGTQAVVDVSKLTSIDPMTAAPDDFASYLAAHSNQAGMLARKRAEILWSEKKFSEAVVLLRTAASRVPAVAEIHYSLGFSLQQAGQHLPAIEAFTRALELGYAEFWVRYARGNSYAALGDKPEAMGEFKRAAQLDPSHAGPKAMLESLER